MFSWAGEFRTVNISKSGNFFGAAAFIEPATCLGDINAIPPFREGNGRTQLQYLKQLCRRAGQHLDLRCISGAAWIEASRRAYDADYGPRAEAIRAALSASQDWTAKGDPPR